MSEPRAPFQPYQDPKDLARIPDFGKLAPEAAQAFLAFDHACFAGDEAVLPRKTRELIALAVALTTQCAYCLDVHSQGARKAGATAEELAQTALIAAAVRAGGSLSHGLMLQRLFEREGAPPPPHAR